MSHTNTAEVLGNNFPSLPDNAAILLRQICLKLLFLFYKLIEPTQLNAA